MTRRAKLAYQRADLAERAFQRAEVGQLAADVHRDALHREPRQLARPCIGLDRTVDRNAELGVGGAGRNLAVGAGDDVRIDSKGDRRVDAERGRHLRHHFRLDDRFQVELAQPDLERIGHFAGGLADARKHDPLGREAGGDGAAELADRHDVGAHPLGGKRRQHRRVGIGLDGKGGQRIDPADRRAEHPRVALHRCRGIDIDGGADRRGDVGQRHVLAMQRAVAKVEMVHR